MTAIMDRPIRRSKWHILRKWPLAIAMGSAAIVSLITVFGAAERNIRIAASTVIIEPVVLDVFHDFIPLRGTIVPRDTIYIDAVSGGQVQRVLVEPGDKVVVGQPLVEFANTALQLQVIQQESQLNQAITQLQSNQTILEQNRITNERALALLDYNIIRDRRSVKRRRALAGEAEPVEQMDIVQDQLDYELVLRPLQAESNATQEAIRLGQLPLIQEQLKQLQKNLDIVRGKLDDLIARSPIAGEVTNIDLKIGENKNQGERLATITPATGVKVQAEVDEFYLGRVRADQTADIDLSGRHWKLKATRVYPQVTNGTFKVDLTFENDIPAGLLPGQAVQGKLSLGDDSQGAVLPAGAFLERSGGDWVFVVSTDGHAARRKRIKIGRRSAEQVEVLAGLMPGERVITSDYTGLERIDRVDLTQ